MLNDFISFDRKVPVFIAKESKKTLKKGDVVYAKISTVALKNTVADTKIAMTMRPTGLGKEEWLIGESL
jgi:DNA-directed RNA polymerase subunit E'